MPNVGWIDFDPTSGGVGATGLVTVAVVRDPHHAIPLHGTFVGSPSDNLGMEVQVSVTADGRASRYWPLPDAPHPRNSSDRLLIDGGMSRR
jgi:transglutaminase-like putative cysteine protease